MVKKTKKKQCTTWLDFYAARIIINAVFEDMILVPYIFCILYNFFKIMVTYFLK